MASKPIVKLPNEWIDRSNDYALQTVLAYERGENAASRAVSSHGAEADIYLQAHARMAECAVCLHFRKDPARALNWSNRCDPGWDLVAYDVRWDIKATVRGQYLIWPINKRHLFASKRFDALALVRGEAPNFMMVGFIIKPRFKSDHHVADENHCLDAGTWYMHESELWGMQ